MFLTRFAVNPARRGAQKLLGSPHAMHAAVMSSFPPEVLEPTDAGRVLWRVDRGSTATHLFVLSPALPDLTHLVEQAGWPLTATWDTRPYAPFLHRLADGQIWAFRLRANPVKAAKDVGKIVGHLTAEQQSAWLSARASSNGFRILQSTQGTPALSVSEREKQQFRRGDDRVTLVTARFDGVLQITDVSAFRSVLARGLGRAKGYGCGLMTLARPQP